jgi:hypothetical protein
VRLERSKDLEQSQKTKQALAKQITLKGKRCYENPSLLQETTGSYDLWMTTCALFVDAPER